MISSDQEGLNKAYNTEDGLFEDTNTNTLFIAGTRNLKDVSQWPKIPLFKTKDSNIYNIAKKYLDEHPNIANLVGHSYGGSAALQFQKDNNKYETRTYGAPVFDPIPRNPWHKPQRYCNRVDPVCSADLGAEKQEHLTNFNLNTHSYYNTSTHYGRAVRPETEPTKTVIQPSNAPQRHRRIVGNRRHVGFKYN